MRLGERDQEVAALEELVQELQETNRTLEWHVVRWLHPDSAPDEATTGPSDLDGRAIVYVGGRPSLVPHFRSLVERSNGRFVHHDGGIEDSRAALECVLAGADTVLCPTDCVSHDACRRIKRYCWQNCKRFLTLSSSGLSAFSRALGDLSAAAAPPGQGAEADIGGFPPGDGVPASRGTGT